MNVREISRMARGQSDRARCPAGNHFTLHWRRIMNRVLFAGLAALALTSAGAQAATINEMPAHDVTINARPDVQDLNGGGDFRAIVGGTSAGSDYHVPLF